MEGEIPTTGRFDLLVGSVFALYRQFNLKNCPKEVSRERAKKNLTEEKKPKAISALNGTCSLSVEFHFRSSLKIITIRMLPLAPGL